MSGRYLSREVRELVQTGGPPYDPEKVMAWFNQQAEAMLIELEVLEEDYADHNPKEMLTDERQKELRPLIAEVAEAIRPFFEQYYGMTGGVDPSSARLGNEFLYILEQAIYACTIDARRK